MQLENTHNCIDELIFFVCEVMCCFLPSFLYVFTAIRIPETWNRDVLGFQPENFRSTFQWRNLPSERSFFPQICPSYKKLQMAKNLKGFAMHFLCPFLDVVSQKHPPFCDESHVPFVGKGCAIHSRAFKGFRKSWRIFHLRILGPELFFFFGRPENTHRWVLCHTQDLSNFWGLHRGH